MQSMNVLLHLMIFLHSKMQSFHIQLDVQSVIIVDIHMCIGSVGIEVLDFTKNTDMSFFKINFDPIK